MPFESTTLNTGSFLRDVQEGGQEDRGDPGRNSHALGKWRRGRRSRSPAKPDTRGILPMAQALRLWKYGVHRESANQVPSERVSCPRALLSWMPAQWHPTRVQSCGCRRNGNSGFMVAPWRSTKGVEPDAVQAARHRVAGECYHPPAPSEPDMKVSLHPAQALGRCRPSLW